MVYKPQGWEVEAEGGAHAPSVLGRLAQMWQPSAGAGAGAPPPHSHAARRANILPFGTRLDVAATGLILVAGNMHAVVHFSWQMQTYTMSRSYVVALAGGHAPLRLAPRSAAYAGTRRAEPDDD